MAQRRKEERARKAELNRLDNEECGEEEEEEEDMTDESEVEEVGGCLFLAALEQSNYFIHTCAFIRLYSCLIFSFTRM